MSCKLNSDEVDKIVCDFYNNFTSQYIQQSKEGYNRSEHLAALSLTDMFSSWFTDAVASLPRDAQDKILSNLNVNVAVQNYL